MSVTGPADWRLARCAKDGGQWLPIVHPPTLRRVRSLTTREAGMVENHFGGACLLHQFKMSNRKNAGFPIHDAPRLNNSLPRHEFKLEMIVRWHLSSHPT